MSNPSTTSTPPEFPVDALLGFEGEIIRARVKNISTGGAVINTERPISATKQVFIELVVAPARKISLTGTVVYSYEIEPDLFETGIRFQELSDEMLRFVTELMLRKALHRH